MDYETWKFVIGSGIQLLLGVGAWYLAYTIGKGQIEKQNEQLKIDLYDRRYVIYLAFKDFVSHCVVNDCPSRDAFRRFTDSTEKIDFLFGREILGYKKELTANSLAIMGIETNVPCVSPPVVGGLVGYFPGSTILTDRSDLGAWFFRQFKTDLQNYFKPYLDFSKAGADTNVIVMQPPELPDPPLVRRKIQPKNEKDMK